MYDFFVRLLNMSLAASVIVLVIVVLRLLLKKAPRNILCFLWTLVALRLILPFSIQSDFSAFNVMQSSVDRQGQIEYFQYNGKTEKPKVEFSVPALVNDNASPDSMTIGEHTSDLYLPPVVGIWLAGACVMLLYAAGSYLYLRKKTAASIPRHDGLRTSDDVSAPFILGIVKPVIYVPSGMDEKTLQHVAAHEKAHIKRRDHWWKPLGFFLLSIYWFNPMIWLAYVLLCRDIELACDENVIRDMDACGVAEYSQALLDCSFPRRRIAACPLAFGEVGVKERVRSVLNYKKPAFWIITVAVAACIVVAVCFMTDPVANEPDLSFLNYENACSLVADVTDVDTVYYPPTKRDEDGQISLGYVSGNDLARYLDSVSWQKRKAPQKKISSPGSIVFSIGDDHHITVYQQPRLAMVTYGDEVRYYKTHDGDYDNAIKLFRKWSSSLQGETGADPAVPTLVPTPDPTPSAAPAEELKLDQAFPWQRESSTVPDVFSIVSNDYPNRYDLTAEERTALWELLRAAKYTPVTFESVYDEIEPYSDSYSLTGTYEGYFRISWYYEGAPSFGNAQLYPGNVVGAGDWYRYDADSFDFALLRKLCDVPQTVYPKTEEEIRDASSALKAFWEKKGNTVQRIWFDEKLCSACMDAVLHSGPAGQRTKAKAEDTIVLLMDCVSGADDSPGTELITEYAVLHRTNDGTWEFIINYPI